MHERASFLDRLAAVAAAHPDRPAVLTGGTEVLTYRELLEQADRLAGGLAANGAGPETLVGLGLGRSAEFVTAVVGCWRAGVAFLPFDTRWPPNRVAFVVRDSGLSLAVADGKRATDLGQLGVTVLPAGGGREPGLGEPGASATGSALPPNSRSGFARVGLPPPARRDERLAYCIYTSGSTGRPKGVLVEPRGIVNLLDTQVAAFGLTPGSRVLWVLSPAFDASVSDIGTALLSGATLCVEHDDDLRDPVRLTRILHDRGVTHVDLPPALLRVLDPNAMPPTLRTVVIGGEPAPAEAVRRWARRVRVVNVYGPTEATVCTSLCVCDPETWSDPLLGRPIPGIRYHVLDEEMNPVSPGGVGELYIGGVGLARGYLNRPELTAAKFVTHRGERLYRTGDRVRLREDGEYVFVGRADRQFKLRGQLVEPGEVEARLMDHPGVREAAVLKRPVDGRDALVAAVVRSDGGVSPTVLRDSLARSLPPWMVPQHVEFVASLPRTTSGKVDYPRLESSPLAPRADVSSSPVPADGTEAALAEVWSRVLGRAADPAAGFIEQGGDSLGVLEVTAAAHARGLTVPPALIADGRTIPEIAAWLRAGDGGSVPPGAMTAAELEADAAGVLESSPLAPRADVSSARGASGLLSPRTLLLTGAIGFLGSWLLRELLARTDAEVVCLVRDPRRLSAGPRVRPVVGDMERPRLGLSDASWDDLAGRVDTVYHCAAAVNVVLPYARLRAANLLGTAEVLRFLGSGRPKRLHYASTLSVFVATDRNRGVLREEDDLTATRSVYGGYAQTKWAAERLLRLAGGRFGPVAHYRLGLVTGDTVSGRSPSRDFLTLFLRGLTRIGGCPAGVERELFIDLTPVDYAAAAMTHLSLNATGCDTETFHIANPRSLSLAEVLDAVRAAGVRLDPLDPQEFRERVRALDGDAAAACLGLCRGLPGADAFDRLRTADLFQATGVTFDQQNTAAGLAGSGLACPPPSPELLAKYVAAALADGGPR